MQNRIEEIADRTGILLEECLKNTLRALELYNKKEKAPLTYEENLEMEELRIKMNSIKEESEMLSKEIDKHERS